jgi:hypothetical protein
VGNLTAMTVHFITENLSMGLVWRSIKAESIRGIEMAMALSTGLMVIRGFTGCGKMGSWSRPALTRTHTLM